MQRREILDQLILGRAFGVRPLSGSSLDRRSRLARGAPRPRASARSGRRACAQARDGHSRSAGGSLFRHDADPRKAARTRFPDHAQLSPCQPLQHPRRIDRAHGQGRAGTGIDLRVPRPDFRLARRARQGGAMDRTSGGAPLLSLDAVVIDTETTGLDPRKARVIELAGVRLAGGKLAADGSFRQLLRPGGESIPAETTRIHGIDDAMVAAIAAVRGCLAALRCVSRSGRGDRAHGRVRPCHAEARMRSRRPAVAAAAHARYAAAGADRRAGTGRLYAGEPRRLAGRRRRRPAFRARRRDNDGAGVSGAAAEAARPRYPDRCRSRTGLPRPHFRARRSGAAAAGSRPSRLRRAPTRNEP